MSVPTLAAIRARWPALTSTVISDDDLTSMRTEAGDRVPAGLGTNDDTTARIHLTAHLSLGFINSSSLGGMTAGNQTAQSAAFRDRSISRAVGATSTIKARSIQEADLMSTLPGRLYLTIVGQIMPPAVVTGSSW